MSFSLLIKNSSLIVLAILASCQSKTQKSNSLTESLQKEVYLPDTVWMVPNNNNYAADTSTYCFKHSKESENVALFWHKDFGDDPMLNPDSTLRFDVDQLSKECERIYNYYVNDLKFVQKGKSITDKYKALIFIFSGEDGSAYGGGEDEKVGIFWAPPSRMRKEPFGALAHELGHSFQYLLKADGAPTFSAGFSIYEMTSQFMLWQVYPQWMTFENYHLVDFMKQTHYAFLHEINMYHSPYILEYWSNKHGLDFIGKLWGGAQEGEDAVMAYKRITEIDQATFNDEIFDAACRFITWDMTRIDDVAKPYRNQHSCKLNPVDDGWFRIDKSRCPQNYGYNGIKLEVPDEGKVVMLRFKGIAGAEGFNTINTDKAGWRYGFVAYGIDGSRKYGEVNSSSNGVVEFKVPKNTQYLWLVVCGAPTEHWIHEIDWKDENDEQWPYQIKLSGTTLDDSVLD